MWFVIGILILIGIFFGIYKISQLFSTQLQFISKGLDLGFSFFEIKLLWNVSKQCKLLNPITIFLSADVLNQCIFMLKSSAEVDDTINYSKTQKILTKLYDFKSKIEHEADKKRGLDSTKYLDSGQKLRIILPGKGVFSSEILNNGHNLIIKVPTQKDQIVVEGKDWVNQTISVYLWRKEDARYVFDTSVEGCGIFLGKAAIFLKHSSNLVRTQKRNSLRAKCDIDGVLYILKDKKINYNEIGNSGGYRCKLEDISEKGALIRAAGKGLANIQIRIQFQLENHLIVMFGIIRTVEYNQNINQSRLHFECIHVESVMKNYILSYVYKILPQKEKDIYDAQKLIDQDEDENPLTEPSLEEQQTENEENQDEIFISNTDEDIPLKKANISEDFVSSEIPEDV